MKDKTTFKSCSAAPRLTKYIIPLITLTAVFLSGSCEKPVFDDKDTTKKENNKDTASKGEKDKNKDKSDNGGWANDEKDDEDNGEWSNGEEWQEGDTVNVATFKARDFDEAIWVKGYIVGCASTTGGYKYSFAQPFESMTSILIADSKKENDKKNAVAIQLKSGSDIRADLNLSENPENYRRAVAVYGYKTTYLRIDGMKEILDYELK